MASPIDVRLIANLSPPDWWTIGLTGGATLIGAIIGAVIAYLVARQTANESRQAASAARRADEEAAAIRVGVKLTQLLSAAAGYHHQTEDGLKRAADEIGEGKIELWRSMKAVISRTDVLTIDSGDLVIFTKAREFEFVPKLIFVFDRFNTMTFGVAAYSQRRDELLAMTKPVEMRGLVGTTVEDQKEWTRLAPYRAEVDDLAGQAREDMREVYELAVQVMNEYGPIVRRYFNDPTFPIFAPKAIEAAESQEQAAG